MALVLNGSGITSANIADGTITTDDILASDVSSLKSGRKNLIINGGMDVWQRGTSFSPVNSNTYSADRWYGYYQNTTLSQVTEIYNGTKIKALKVDSTNASYFPWVAQKIEGNSWASNKTLTVSFLVKGSVGFSDLKVSYDVRNGSGSILAGAAFTTTTQVTTSFVRHSFTATIADISAHTLDDAGSNVSIRFNKNAVAAADFTIAQVQLELGSVATDFEHRSYGEELALCQRYYWNGKSGQTSSYLYGASSMLGLINPISFPVTLRAAPTVGIFTAGGYTNCSFNQLNSSIYGMSERVTVSSSGGYRAEGQIYYADSEL